MSYEPHADRWLRRKRAQTGMTQKQLARATGLTVRDIQRMEEGNIRMFVRKYMAIALYFNVPMDQFLFDEEEVVE